MQLSENCRIDIEFSPIDVYAIASEMREVAIPSDHPLRKLIEKAFALLVSNEEIKVSLTRNEARLVRAVIIGARAGGDERKFPNIKDLGSELHRMLGCAP